MNYCSHCGAPGPVLEIPEGDSRPRFICKSCDTIHYSNPNIVAGCLPIWEDKVLLCRRAIAPRVGYWNVPSGYLENGETVEEGRSVRCGKRPKLRWPFVGYTASTAYPILTKFTSTFLPILKMANTVLAQKVLRRNCLAKKKSPGRK